VKITLAQLNYHPGNFELNTKKMLDAIAQAKKEGSQLIVFAELATCGYPAKDLLDFDSFIDNSNKALTSIAKACDTIAAIVGCPVYNKTGKGKRLFNAAVVIENKQIKNTIHKQLLPTYDIFDEYRYFEPGNNTAIVEINGHKIALTICEDLWNLDDVSLYQASPMEQLCKLNPDLIINIAASPFSKTQLQTRRRVMQRNALKYNLPIVYVNHVGAQTDLIFDGGSFIMNANGETIAELNMFEEDLQSFELKDKVFETSIGNQLPNHEFLSIAESIEKALVIGIQDYFKKLNFKKAIIGLSGGIDSALVLYLAVKALGSENVLAVLLPSKYSSEHSVSDAVQLANNLKVQYHNISIEAQINAIEHSLNPYFKDTPFGIAEENIQSRSRAILLMALSNKFGYILLNTSNKSELAVGYGTLYGDMCGGLSVIGDLYKTEVYELSNFINREQEIIPQNILHKEPSAELRPDQKDSDSLPAYEVLDQILKFYLEENLGFQQMIEKGFEAALVQRIMKMVNANEWKRWQAPPVLRVSSKSFGTGRKMPIEGIYNI